MNWRQTNRASRGETPTSKAPPRKLEIDSSEGAQLLRARGVTTEPCPRGEHRGNGGTQLVFNLDAQQQPDPVFTNGRVLFFTCSGCNTERYHQAMPDCPEAHRPYRYYNVSRQLRATVGCHACNRSAILSD